MNELKHLRDLKAELESAIKEDLYSVILENRMTFHEGLVSFAERLQSRSMATNNPVKLLSVLDEELQTLRTIVDRQKEQNLADTYLNAVKKQTMDFEPLVTVSQSKDRFEKQREDNLRVSFVKFLKRTARTTISFWRGFANIFRKMLGKPTRAYGPWTQKIPFRSVTEYHLSDVEPMLKSWMNQDQGYLVQLILELEAFMAEDIFYEEFAVREKDKEIDGSLDNRIRPFLEEVRNAKQEIAKDLQGEFENLFREVSHKLERAGTLERRRSFYQNDKVEKKYSKVRSSLATHVDGWHEAHTYLIDKGRMVRDFLDFKQKLEEESRDYINTLEDFFGEHLKNPLQSLQRDIAGIGEKLEQFQKKQETVSARHLISDSKNLLQKLVQDIQQILRKSVEDTKLSRQSNLFAENGFLKANKLSEQGLFIDDLDLDKKPPELDHIFIEWRLLVVRGLKEYMFNKLQPSNQHYEDFLVRINGNLEEVLQIVEVNMDSALELLGSSEEKSEGDPFDTVVEALERTDAKIAAVLNTSEEKLDQLQTTVLDGGREFCQTMMHLVHAGDAKELQILDAKYKVKQKAKGWQTRFGARWARIQDSVALFWRFGWKKLKTYGVAVRKFLGFEEQEVKQVAKTDVATYLSETDAKIKELPYIYRRLFDFDMVTDRRFYVALNENFSYLKKAYESWENGYPSTFAVVGENGSGKSTYLNYALEDFFTPREVKIIELKGDYYSEVDFIKFMQEELGLDGVDSVDSVVTAIRNTKKKRVLVIENLQNFYLRNINGYGALESLLYVISETRESTFWIVSASRYAWNYLNSALSVGEYFSHNIQTDTLDEQQIEAVIMNRHRSSGYELVFEPNEGQIKSRAYRKLMDQEEASHQYLKEAYFEDLTNLSEGNASIAMIFWIRSIREFDDTHFYLKPLEVTSLEMIQELQSNVLFTLAAIVLHDTVTPKELSAVLQMTEQESRLMLMRLKTRGLLEEEGNRYHINQLMYRQIVRVLKGKNIIHLV